VDEIGYNLPQHFSGILRMPDRDIYGGGWPYDEYAYGPAGEIRHARDMLAFKAPSPSPRFQRVAAWLNRVLYLRFGMMRHGRATPVIARSELAKLRAIPSGAGNLLVGPHPGPLDPSLMFYLATKAYGGPLAFLVAEELYYGGTFIRRAVLSRLGAMPVARGNRNPEAIRCMTEHLASGRWAGIYPEGELYFSREVMPMEYGALRIATEAAIKIQHCAARGSASDGGQRPLLVTPFAHVYFSADPAKTVQCIARLLAELESHQEIFGEQRSGSLPERICALAEALLEHKAREHGIPDYDWRDPDIFASVRRFRDTALARLETQYGDGIQTGYARRRLLKVRMVIYERLGYEDLPDDERQELERDLQLTRELVLSVPFTRAYFEKYGDLEMWAEFLRRFTRILQTTSSNLGPQNVVFKVLEPIDMHAVARDYQALPSEDAKLDFLFAKTDELRQTIQTGVDEICAAQPKHRLPGDNSGVRA